jgi:hypothetical protein
MTIPRRYDHGEFVDTSIDGLWMKGPRFEDHVETISATAGEVRQLVKAMHGGVLTVFAICENGIWRRVADGNWTPSLTTGTVPALPAGTYPQRAQRFKHRSATPLDALYVATNNSNLYRYDGAVWTVAAAAAGPGTGVVNGEARYLERVGDELWVAGDYWVVKVEDDPMVRANYAAVIWIGDQTTKVTWLKQIENTLYVWKEDGLYTIDADGVDVDLFPTLRGKNDPENGRNAAVWINRIWFTFGDQTLTLTGDATLTPDGLEQMLENTSDVRGRWVGGAGHNTWFFYEMYYNTLIDTTYLVKHGTWVEEGSSQNNPGVSQFADAHHGALFSWDKLATSIEILDGLHTGGNDRLYVGFLDGTVQWAVLPQTGPNPMEDSRCEFTGNDSYVYLPYHHSGFRADNKLFHAITAFGPRLTPTEWAEVEYRLDVSNELAEWTTLAADDPRFVLPGMKLKFSEDESEDPVFGKLIQIRVKLAKDPDVGLSPLSLSPAIHGIGIHESIRPAFSREFTFTVGVKSYMALRDGKVDRRRGTDIQEAVMQSAAEVGTVVVLLPTGEYEEMTIIDYQDVAIAEINRRDFEWGIKITAIQLRTISHDRVFYGMTYDTLEQFTLDQLETII